MSATLSLAREAFIRVMNRDTVPAERTRMLVVLDAMVAWSLARPELVRFRADDNDRGIVRFERVDSSAVFWAARPRPQDSPMLELLPASSRLLAPEVRASAIDMLNSHTRATLDPNGRLNIGFGALKNDAARAAVLELMTQLLDQTASTRRASTPVS